MKRFIALLLTFSSAANAQSTACFVNGQWINCTTHKAPQFNTAPTDFLSGMGAVDAPPARQIPPQQAVTTPPPELTAAWAHLADLIREHKCAEAVDFSVRMGGTEAGLRAKALCQ